MTLGWLITRENKGGLIWIITVVTGLVIWGIRNGDVPHWSFIVVATAMSALLMLGWRGVAKLVKKDSRFPHTGSVDDPPRHSRELSTGRAGRD